MLKPELSIVMSAHLTGEYLDLAVESVLAQTFENFEFVVVDDSGRGEVAGSLSGRGDERIKVLINDENIGLTKSLNRALAEVRAPFVARMDADDVARPDRIEKQLARMKSVPGLAALGTWVNLIDEKGAPAASRNRFNVSPGGTLLWRLHFHNCLAHPSMMFRKNAIDHLGGYCEDFRVSQDYELYSRLAWKNELNVLPEPLLDLRVRRDQVSALKNDEEKKLSVSVTGRMHQILLGREISETTAAMLQRLAVGELPEDEDGASELFELVMDSFSAFRKKARDHGIDSSGVKQDAMTKARALASRMKSFGITVGARAYLRLIRFWLR